MAEKFAIYFGEPLASATVGYENSRSARVNQVTSEWLSLMRDNMPALSVAQWQALAAITSGTDLGDDNTLRLLWAAVADAPDECAAHGVSPDDLAATLRALPLAGRYALRETLARLWADVDAGGDIQTALGRLGVQS